MKRTTRFLCVLVILIGTFACSSKVVPPEDLKGNSKRKFILTDLDAKTLFAKMQARAEAIKLEAEGEVVENKEEFIVLDVREENEYNEGHIPGAIWIPYLQLRTRHAELDPNKLIVVYCRSGNRSKTGSSILIHNGFDKVVNLSGGTLDWQKANYPLIKGMSPYATQEQANQ